MLAAEECDSPPPIIDYSQLTDEGELAYEIHEIPLKMSSSRTIRSNKTAANNFREYLRENGIDEQFEKFNKETLNKTLGQFYVDARQADGTHYKVNSLENFRYGINRYLKSAPYFRKFDIIKDEEFSDANHYFKLAITELRRLGKGDVDHHPVITDIDLKTLYASIHLDPNTPAGLLNKVQFDIRMYFFRRGMENMSKMRKSTFKVTKDPETGLKIVVKVDENGNQNENDHENITGIMPECVGSSMCPVKSFELYLSKVHPDCDRLWQRPREHFCHNDEVWFCRSAVGEKNLAKFMSNLSKVCLLSQTYTNHSIRATGASILHNFFEPAQIMAVMGQKSAVYLSGYQRVTNKEKISMGQAITASLGNAPSLVFPSSLKSLCDPIELDIGTIFLENQEQTTDMITDLKASHSENLKDVGHPNETSKLAERNDQIGTRGEQMAERHGQMAARSERMSERREQLSERCDQMAETSEGIPSRFNWILKLKNPSLKKANNGDLKTSDNHGNKREASATVTSAEQEEQHPSKILRRYFEGKNCKQRENSSSVSIVEPSRVAKERHASKSCLPQTKVTFHPTAQVPPTQHRKLLVVSEHQCNVMTNLVGLWKKGQLCDAGIGNGTTIVMVHKIILLAVCPKLLTMFNNGGQSNRFLQVNFPQAISHEALTAFAEYIYSGVLDLNARLLNQLRQMALQLGMKELEMLCSAHLSPHEQASEMINIDPNQRPSSPYDSIQIVNFSADDVSSQDPADISTQLQSPRKRKLSSSIYQRLVISSPEVMLQRDENKHSVCLSPSLDRSLHDIDIENNKFEELVDLPASDIQDPYIASLDFGSPPEKLISISNIKTEPISIDDDESCDDDQTNVYPHNAPTASPADVLTTNYSPPVNQLQKERLVGSKSRTHHKRKCRSTVNRIRYTSEDEMSDNEWQGVSFRIKKEKLFNQPSMDKDNEPFPVEMISVVRNQNLSNKSAPD